MMRAIWGENGTNKQIFSSGKFLGHPTNNFKIEKRKKNPNLLFPEITTKTTGIQRAVFETHPLKLNP